MVSLDDLLNERPAVLVLGNGTILHGTALGATKQVFGELVFTTQTAVGFCEALTTSNSLNQIVVFSYPLLGNYGVPAWEKDKYGITSVFESDSIKCSGIVIHEACKNPSHFQMKKTLHQFLVEQNVPGIEGMDTRALTQMIRDAGPLPALLQTFGNGDSVPSDSQLMVLLQRAQKNNGRNLVEEVSIKAPKEYNVENAIGTVVVIDCGVKNSILQILLSMGLNVIQVPYNFPFAKIIEYKPNGVIISNGPGDPTNNPAVITTAKELISAAIPTLGICLGSSILGLAAGAKINKMKGGHRGGNKPVINLKNGRGYITAQDHQYVIDNASLKSTEFLPLFEHVDDHTNEGIYHPKLPIISCNFYPGTADNMVVMDMFLKIMKLERKSASKGGN